MYTLKDNQLSANYAELKSQKKKTDNGKEVKELISVDNIKTKLQPPRVSDAELEVLIANYIYQYIDGNSLNQHQINLLSVLLELKSTRGSKHEV